MADHPRWRDSAQFDAAKRRMAAKSFFGIDKETDLVKIAKAHMAIAGDGRSNIVHENALHSADEFESEAARCFISRGSFKRFDLILTNPPFGTKTKVLEQDAAAFDLGHTWNRNRETGVWRKTDRVCQRDPYVLFVERCMSMLKESGTLGMVLPESVFHAPTLGYLRQYLLANNNLVAIIDLPHNTFRPNCNAKTCLVVLRKGERQGESVIMATPKEMGHDLGGRPLYRPRTHEIWDDLKVVLDELDDPGKLSNKHVFEVPWADIDRDVLVPRFYRGVLHSPPMPAGYHGVRLSDLENDGTLEAWDGHGSPPGETKGQGTIPYIRVKDIVNWEMYRNPVSLIPEDVYRKIKRNGVTSQAGDVILVRRGSYRIGTVAMASPRDNELLLTRELLTLRLTTPNRWGLSPFYLLAALSTPVVQQQIQSYVLVDTTLPNMGDRWRHLVIPVPDDPDELKRISAEVERSVRDKWAAQDRIDSLRQSFGDMVT